MIYSASPALTHKSGEILKDVMRGIIDLCAESDAVFDQCTQEVADDLESQAQITAEQEGLYCGEEATNEPR